MGAIYEQENEKNQDNQETRENQKNQESQESFKKNVAKENTEGRFGRAC